MGIKPFTQEIQAFILANIDSIAQLEILSLLFHARDLNWTVSSVAQELRSTDSSVELHLRSLVNQNLLTEEKGSFQYRPHSAELDQLAQKVIQAYQEKRVSVTTLIYNKPIEKMREFADAFKLRKDK